MKPGGPLGGGRIREGSWKASSTGTAQSRGPRQLEGMLGGDGAGCRSPGVKGFAVAESLLSVEGVWAWACVPTTGGVAAVGNAAVVEGVATMEEVAMGGVDTCFRTSALDWRDAFGLKEAAFLPSPFPLPAKVAVVPEEAILTEAG